MSTTASHDDQLAVDEFTKPLDGQRAPKKAAAVTRRTTSAGGSSNPLPHSHRRPSPSPCNTSKEDAELYWLLERYDRGDLEPAKFALPKLPKGASDLARRKRAAERTLAGFYELLWGLRYAVEDDGDLPCSRRLVARRVGPRSPMRVKRASDRLEAAGVIHCTASLPPRNGLPEGTRLYAPARLRMAALGPPPAVLQAPPPVTDHGGRGGPLSSRQGQARQAQRHLDQQDDHAARAGAEGRGRYGLIERNPARGKRRRLKADRPAPVWLDSAEQIEALLDAAGELDREAQSNRQVPRRAILAALTFAGLRIGELIELRWRDVDLAAGRLTVRASKTDAGARTIDLLPILRDELATLKARAKPHSHERVFPTREGGPMNASNVRNRTLALSVERANERLEVAGSVPLPAGLTPHKLRHTFASLLVALGTDPGAAMDQLGHADPGFTLRVYRHAMRRDDDSRAQLAQLVGAPKRHQKGTSVEIGAPA